MNEFLLVIETEEVPFLEHKKQNDACNYLENYGFLEVFSSACYLVIRLTEFKTEIYLEGTKIKGPNINAKEEAINGFLKKYNISKQDLKEENGFFVLETQPQTILFAERLQHEILPELFKKLASAYSKTMVWNSTNAKWIRPINNIFTSLNNEIVNFQYAGIKAKKGLNFKDFTKLMIKKNIIINQEQRKSIITSKVQEIENKYKIKCIAPERLIEENSFLTSFPSVYIDEFDKKYLEIPKKVLILTLESNQKYLLFTQNTTLTNIFAICIDGNFDKKTLQSIAQGNKKVLNARLEDAIYYIKIDLQKKLETRLHGLQNLMFHINAGSVFERIGRMQKLFEQFKTQIPSELHHNLQTVIKICKADLQTEMVQSFPELQGYIGSFYSLKEGYNKEVCSAIENQYKLGIEVEQAPKLDAYFAIIEKLEKIQTLMSCGEKPTSSRDPFGIRRDALAIIKIIIANQINLSFTINDIFIDRLNFYFKNYTKTAVELCINFEKTKKEFSILNIYNKVTALEKNPNSLIQFTRIFKLLSSDEVKKNISKNTNAANHSLVLEFQNCTTFEDLLHKANKIDEFFASNLVIDETNIEGTKQKLAVLQEVLNIIEGFVKFT